MIQALPPARAAAAAGAAAEPRRRARHAEELSAKGPVLPGAEVLPPRRGGAPVRPVGEAADLDAACAGFALQAIAEPEVVEVRFTERGGGAGTGGCRRDAAAAAGSAAGPQRRAAPGFGSALLPIFITTTRRRL